MKNPALLLVLMTCLSIIPVHGSGWFGKSAAELQVEQQTKAAEEAKKRGFWNKVVNTFGRKTVQTENTASEQTTKAGTGVWAKFFSRSKKEEPKPVVQPKPSLLARLLGRRGQAPAQTQIQLADPRQDMSQPVVEQPKKAGFFRSLFHRNAKTVEQPLVEEQPLMEDIQVEQPKKGWFSWFSKNKQQNTPLLAGQDDSTIQQIPGSAGKEMVGELRKEFKFLIEDLKGCAAEMQKKGGKKEGLFVDRMLLYGPPGNGKSTWAAAIAKKSGSELIEKKGSTIVGSYVGQGAKNVQDAFVEAAQKAQETKRPVVLFIDEFDGFASKKYDSSGKVGEQEYTNAAKTLWLCMDEVRNKKLPIVVLLATNLELKDIDRRIINRFDGFNTVEIKNPDKKDREALLKHFMGRALPEAARKRVCSDTGLMKALVSQSDNMSIRQLENFAQTCRIELTINNRDPEALTKSVLLKLLLENKKKVSADVETVAEKMKRKYQTEFDVAHGVSSSMGVAHSLLRLPLDLLGTAAQYADIRGNFNKVFGSR